LSGRRGIDYPLPLIEVAIHEELRPEAGFACEVVHVPEQTHFRLPGLASLLLGLHTPHLLGED
jgi:hypothetical protein